MSKEYLGLNPENFSPERFMRPATGVVSSELEYLNHQLRNALEGGLRIDKNSLLIGTELEVLFFSKDADPAKLEKKIQRKIDRLDHYPESKEMNEIRAKDNPNYTTEHREKVLNIARFASNLSYEYPNDFYGCTRDSKLLIEFRTAPQTLENHLENLKWLSKSIRKKCQKEGILPVVYSQHIHLSCASHNIRSFEKSKFKFFNSSSFDRGYIDRTFTRILPLVMLPEEYEEIDSVSHVVRTNEGEVTCIDHPEFRQLSSEYAHDHILNLTLCLRSLYAALKNKDFATDISPDNNFIRAVREMSKDSELANFFGESTLAEICRIVKQYPSVSRRIKTIDEVK